MERSEPSLVPEWLKSSGSLGRGVSTNHHITSPHQDNHATLKPARNKSLANVSDHVLGPRTTSSFFCRSSSNGSSHLRSYSSFGRNNRDKDWDKDVYDNCDKEKTILSDHRRQNYSDPLESISPSRLEKDGLRRTQSTISRKDVEPWPRKAPAELKYISRNEYNNGNSLLAVARPTSNVHKAAFDRDFPSLGTEERQKDLEIGRALSPGLGTAIQNLPTGSSTGVVDGGWTSALAEVPVTIGGNGTAASSVPQTVLPSSSSVTSSMTTGLNMAETLSQGPPRIQDTPQLSVETQRLEKLAIKQSRQLIPVTPSMPKALVSNPSDKTKLKVGQHRQTSSAQLVHNSPKGAPMKNDISKTSSLGKLQVLKPARDSNVVPYATKDSLSPISSNKLANGTLATASVVVSTPLRSPVSSPILVNVARKPAPPVLIPPMLEKRSTSQAKSRNDFFNSMRKKSMSNYSSAVSGPVSAVSPSVLDKPSDAEATAPLISQGRDTKLGKMSDGGQMNERRDELIGNSCGPLKSLGNGKIHSSPDVILSSEEEEAAFLRSLGWEENAGEDEGLTKEEINAFYRDVSKYISSVPSPKTLLGKPKYFGPLNFQMGSIGGISSGVSSSNSKLDS